MGLEEKGIGRRDAIKRINLMALTAILSPQLFFRNIIKDGPDTFNRNNIQFFAIGRGANNIMSLLMERHGYYKGLGIMTDSRDIERFGTHPIMLIGKKSCGGSGCGDDPEFGRLAAMEDSERIIHCLSRGHKNIIIACLGGGTGTGAGPVVAKWSYDMGIDTFGVVTLPFNFEGEKRFSRALNGLREFQRNTKYVSVNKNPPRSLKSYTLFKDMITDSDNRIATRCENLVKVLMKIDMKNLESKKGNYHGVYQGMV